MLSLLQRFAQAVIAKLNKLAHEYTVVPADETTETVAQTAARRVTVKLLELLAHVVDSLPLHPLVWTSVHDDLTDLGRRLWGIDPHHLSMDGVAT